MNPNEFMAGLLLFGAIFGITMWSTTAGAVLVILLLFALFLAPD